MLHKNILLPISVYERAKIGHDACLSQVSNIVRRLINLNVQDLLDIPHTLNITLSDEADSYTHSPKATHATNTAEVVFGVIWHVVVDHQ